MQLIIRAKFVEVAAHATLRIETRDTTRLSPNIVVVRPASETDIVEVAEIVKVEGEGETALTQTETDGLTFDAEGFELEIPASENPPTGKTLSIVLTGSDGERRNPRFCGGEGAKGGATRPALHHFGALCSGN